jgi:hypothetical protein
VTNDHEIPLRHSVIRIPLVKEYVRSVSVLLGEENRKTKYRMYSE